MNDPTAAANSPRNVPLVGSLVAVALFAFAARVLIRIAYHSPVPFRERHGLDAIIACAFFTALTLASASVAAVLGKRLNRTVCVLAAMATGTMASLLYEPILGAIGGLIVGAIVAAEFGRPAAVAGFWASVAVAAGSLVGLVAFALTDTPVDPAFMPSVMITTALTLITGEFLIPFVATRAAWPPALRRKFAAGLVLLLPFSFGTWVGLSLDTLWRVRLIQGTTDVELAPFGPHWLSDGVFHVDGVYMSPSARAADLMRFKRFRNIIFFNDHTRQLSDGGLRYVGELSNPRYVVIDGAPITDAGLVHLRELTRLRLVQLYGTKVHGVGLSHLPPTLPLLYLNGSPITDDGLRYVQHMASLVGLGLDNTAISDAGLEHLRPLTTLQSVSLKGTRISDAGLAALAKLSSLKRLDLSETEITDAALHHLKALPNFTSLSLAGTRVSDAGVNELQEFPSLQLVNLENTGVSDQAIEQLSQARPTMRIEGPNRGQNHLGQNHDGQNHGRGTPVE